MKKRNVAPLVLMISSLVLLLLLQVLWLLSSYDKAYNDLRRQTSNLFRGTLTEMRDSIFLHGLETASIDSLHRRNSGALFFSLNLDTLENSKPGLDSSSGSHERKARQATAEVFLSENVDDSVEKNFHTKIIHNIKSTVSFKNGKKLLVSFALDSLRSDSIQHYFRKTLAREQIDLPFRIKKELTQYPVIDNEAIPGASRQIKRRIPEPPDEISSEKSAITTEWIRFSPTLRYASVFDHVTPYLFFQISAQIIFAFALTLITSAAFWMMYRSMRTQQRLMDLKNDFISNITHELKTPVTTVSVALEALRSFKGLENPQTTKEYLDIAQSELNRLTLLTDKVLKTALLDNPGVNFESETVDLQKTVDQILHSMKLIFDKQKAQVTFEHQGNAFTIKGGSIHLTNVVYNLLDNALKYGGNEPRITIRLEEDQNRVILQVSDTGIGIPAEYKKKIFEKFFRVPTGDVHNIKGYGLGLSYVDSVVRSHHGLIDVASKPGEGSVFTISLPKGI